MNPVVPNIVIVGAGPSGFYVAEALLHELPNCRIHLLDRLAAPHGLVRYGVAPDHQKLKQVAAVFETIAADPRVTVHTGVSVGDDLTLAELRAHGHAVVLATGSGLGRPLGVPGESLAQVHSAAAFVGWYNGHPDRTALRPRLDVESAVVVGHGNVALDVCRLLARPFDDLKASDIPEPMLAEFGRRRIRRIHLLGRGGPAAVKFTYKEFRQLADLPNVRIRLPQTARLSGTWPTAAGADARRTLDWLKTHACEPTDGADAETETETEQGVVVIDLWFDVAPVEFRGRSSVETIALRPTDAAPSAEAGFTLPCELAVTCVGYTCAALPGVPAYTASGAISHCGGQVLDGTGAAVPGLFVTGWAKRGPTGVVGTNRADGVETAQSLLDALPALLAAASPSAGGLPALLKARRIDSLGHADWRRLDLVERAQGAVLGKPREKTLSLADARAALAALRTAEPAS